MMECETAQEMLGETGETEAPSSCLWQVVALFDRTVPYRSPHHADLGKFERSAQYKKEQVGGWGPV